MRRIAELVGQSLKWEQPRALKMEYELRTGDGELAATATVEIQPNAISR